MIVRAFQLSDYAAVQELMTDVLSAGCYTETLVAFGRQLTVDSGLILVAEKNEEIIGLLIGTVDNNRGYYYRIAIAKDHRNKGVARALVTQMKQRFETRKISTVLVAVDLHNEAVLPMYAKLGFRNSDKPAHKLKIVNG